MPTRLYNSVTVTGLAMLLMLVALAGCSSTPAAQDHMAIDAREYDRVYEAARLALRQRGFVLDRQDHRFGRITTLPLRSPTVGEVWHRGNTTAYQSWESTLNQERRIVTVSMTPLDAASDMPIIEDEIAATTTEEETTDATVALPDAADSPPSVTASATTPSRARAEVGAYELRVDVIIERAQQPMHRLAGSIDSGSIVTALSANPVEYERRGIEGVYWQPLERDPYLSQQILADIIRRSMMLPESP